MFRTAVLALVLSFAAPAVAGFPGAPMPGTAHFDLEETYAAGHFEEGLAEARRRFAEDPTDADLTWHIARFLFEIGEQVDRNDTSFDKVGLYTEMQDIAEQGLELRPGDPHITFARGVATGRLGTTRGVIASLFSAKHIERDWKAVSNSGFSYSSLDGNERLPCDADLALGIFYRLVPDSFVVQMLAGTRGSLEKSERHLSKADQCAPGRIGTIKELGVTQLCMGSKGDAHAMSDGLASLARGRQQTAVSVTDRIDHKHIDMLLADPEMACGYSRDGQQDLDTDQLDS